MPSNGAWKAAVLAALVMSVIAPMRPARAQAAPAGPNCDPWVGDLAIVGVDNRPVRNTADLRDALNQPQPDNKVYLTVRQTLPNGTATYRTIKIAFTIGNINRRKATPTEQNAFRPESYYELTSGCINCAIPGVNLGGVNVQVLVNEDDSVAPPVRRGMFTVTAPAKNSPAEQSGLRASDQIVKISGERVSDMPLMQAIKRLQGSKGSDVTLTMTRTVGPDESYTVTLPRW